MPNLGVVKRWGMSQAVETVIHTTFSLNNKHILSNGIDRSLCIVTKFQARDRTASGDASGSARKENAIVDLDETTDDEFQDTLENTCSLENMVLSRQRP